MSENLNQNNEFVSLADLLASENRIPFYNQIMKTYKSLKTKLSQKTLPKIIDILSAEASKKIQDFEILSEASEYLQVALNLIDGANHQSHFLKMSIDENDNSNLTAKIEHKEYELLLMNNETLETHVEELAQKQQISKQPNIE